MIVESDLLFELFIALFIELATRLFALVDRGLVVVEDGHLLEGQLVCLGVVLEAGSNARRTVVKHLALNLFYNS